MKLNEIKVHKCGCKLRKDGFVWIRYSYCKEHEPRHTQHTQILGRRREIFK